MPSETHTPRPPAQGRALLAALLLGGLAACAQPFEVPPPREAMRAVPPGPAPPGPLGPFDYDPRPRAIALCYGNLVNDPEEVMQKAQELCPNNGRLERVAEDAFWNTCALLQPVRVSFVCFPGPAGPSEYR
jgi:hypothetical protein